MTNVALLGTGLLGSGFVENLLHKGHRVRVWNRSADKVAPLVERGAVAGSDPADAVRGAERVHLVLSEDDAVDAVVAALRPGLGEGVPVVDHSTNLPARVAARFTALREQKVRYLHAPVFMAPQHAREASGLMVVSGPTAEVDALRPALESMTGKLWHCGERPDYAAFLKLAGNAVLISMTGIMGDLLSMAQHNDLAPQQLFALFDVFKPAAALAATGQRIVQAGEMPPSFELTMARKDVELMLRACGESQLSVLPALASSMDRSIAQGLGAKDFAVFARGGR